MLRLIAIEMSKVAVHAYIPLTSCSDERCGGVFPLPSTNKQVEYSRFRPGGEKGTTAVYRTLHPSMYAIYLPPINSTI